MQLSKSTPALFVKDIEVSKQFYSKILGLDIQFDFGKNVTYHQGFAIWEIRPNHVIPETLGLENISDSTKNNFELYFETEDLDIVEQALLKNKVHFLHKTHEEPWGQLTLRFFDPDKHIIEIGETLNSFVQRFHNEGMSLEQISQKTHIPVKDIPQLLK